MIHQARVITQLTMRSARGSALILWMFLGCFTLLLTSAFLSGYFDNKEIERYKSLVDPSQTAKTTLPRQFVEEPKYRRLIDPSSQTAKPRVFIVTPTYSRLMQMVDMTRIKQALDSVDNLCWIVIEDSKQKTKRVTNFLASSRIVFVHLNVPSPKSHFKGISQRNLALEWIRNNTDPSEEGVVYFADDDNTYRKELFNLMRYTKGVSVWPVGLVAGVLAERPVCNNSKVISWSTGYRPGRPFAIDMAGFAVNKRVFYKQPNATFDYDGVDGPESQFLEKITTRDKLETPVGCNRVLVWHTKTVKPWTKTAELTKWAKDDSFEV